jgi:hypothetical protein
MSAANGNGEREKAAPARTMDTRIREGEGLPAAGQVAPHGGEARTEFFGRLKIPMQNGVGKKERS